MRKKYIVKLTVEEKERLRRLLSSGKERVRKLTRSRILLKADEGWTDNAICTALDVSRPTVERTDERSPVGAARRVEVAAPPLQVAQLDPGQEVVGVS